MPITVSGTNFEQFISGIEEDIVNSDLMEELGQSLAAQFVSGFQSSGLVSKSGASIKALSYVGEPQITSSGMSIGVGDADALGDPGDQAPSGTLRAFFDDNSDIRPSKWRYIPSSYKDKLEQMRRSGMYGGRGPDYANYLWVQERGNATAEIDAHPFIESSLDQWRQEAAQIIESHLNAKASRY